MQYPTAALEAETAVALMASRIAGALRSSAAKGPVKGMASPWQPRQNGAPSTQWVAEGISL